MACQKGVPLPDSSVAHCRECAGLTNFTLRVPVLFGFQGPITFPLSSSPAGTSG